MRNFTNPSSKGRLSINVAQVASYFSLQDLPLINNGGYRNKDINVSIFDRTREICQNVNREFRLRCSCRSHVSAVTNTCSRMRLNIATIDIAGAGFASDF